MNKKYAQRSFLIRLHAFGEEIFELRRQMMEHGEIIASPFLHGRFVDLYHSFLALEDTDGQVGSFRKRHELQNTVSSRYLQTCRMVLQRARETCVRIPQNDEDTFHALDTFAELFVNVMQFHYE